MLQYKKHIAVEDDSLAQHRERSDQHTAWGTTGLPWALCGLCRYTQQLGPHYEACGEEEGTADKLDMAYQFDTTSPCTNV